MVLVTWIVVSAGCAGMFVSTGQLPALRESLNSTVYVRFDFALNEKRILSASSAVPKIVGQVYSTVSTGLRAVSSREASFRPEPGSPPATCRIQPKFAPG